MNPTVALSRKLESWQQDHRQSDAQTAAYLGISPEQLAALQAERLQTVGWEGGTRGINQKFPTSYAISVASLQDIAHRYGINVHRLYDLVFGEMKPIWRTAHVTAQTFSIGDRVLVRGSHENGRVYKVEGKDADRRYWIDLGLRTRAWTGGEITFQEPNADGAFEPSGPYAADQLRPWH